MNILLQPSLYYLAYYFIYCFLSRFVLRAKTVVIVAVSVSTLLVESSLAQVKVIGIDSVSGAPAEVLPFDQPFILKIPTKSARVTRVAFVPHFGRKSLGESLEYRTKTAEAEAKRTGVEVKDYPEVWKLVNLDSTAYRVQELGKQNYILIEVRDPYLLDPGKTYTFFWAGDTSDEVMVLFDQYDAYARTRSATPANTAQIASDSAKTQKLYDDLVIQNRKTFGEGINIGLRDTNNLKDIERTYYSRKDLLRQKYEELRVKEEAYNGRVDTMTPNVHDATKASYDALLQVISQSSDDFDPKLKTVYLTDIRKATQRISKIKNLDVSTFRQLLRGGESVDCNNCKPTPLRQYENRLANLKITLAAVEEIYTVAEALRASRPALAPAVSNLATLRTTLQGLIRNSSLQGFEGLVEARKAILDRVFAKALSNITKLGGNTHIYSFETRNKLSIAPDVGVVTTRIGNDGANPYSFVPYLGFHINLRPINRDLPFWSYRHKFFHYTSIMVGWSLVSIGNGPKQAVGADSVASFFSKDKGTLLTGLGLRLGNAVRLTGGTMWYFKYYPSATDPVFYDRRRLKSWLFVGVSLDLALKDLLNGISDVFTGAPRTFRPPPATAIVN